MKCNVRLALLTVLALSVAMPCFAVTNFVTNLDGSQEFPLSASTATGVCSGVLNDAQTEFAITCTHNVAGVVTAAHIHAAPVGVNGPVVFPLGVPTSPIVATWSGPGLAANLSDLLAGNLYVNIHSALYPGGEIRGQLRQQFIPTFVANLDGSQEFPSIVSTATGACFAILNNSQTQLSITCTHNVAGVVTAAHIHLAPAGVNGPVVFPLGVPASPIVATWSGPGLATNLSDLFAGNLYVNIHSALHPGGEIRGQLLQQVPARPTAVPTMTEWGMIILMMVLGMGSLYFVRRKRITG